MRTFTTTPSYGAGLVTGSPASFGLMYPTSVQGPGTPSTQGLGPLAGAFLSRLPNVSLAWPVAGRAIKPTTASVTVVSFFVMPEASARAAAATRHPRCRVWTTPLRAGKLGGGSGRGKRPVLDGGLTHPAEPYRRALGQPPAVHQV